METVSFWRKDPTKTQWAEEEILGRRSARGSLVVAAGSWIKFLIQFISTIALARLLGPSEYGAATVILAVGAASALLRESGLFTIASQRYRIDVGLASSLHYVSIAFSLVISVLMALLGPILAGVFDDQRYVMFAIWLAPTFLFAGIAAIPTGILVRNFFTSRLAIIDIASTTAGVGIALFLAANGAGAMAMVVQTVTMAAIQTVMVVLMCPWIPSKIAPWRSTRSAISSAVSMTGVQLLNYATGSADKIIVGAAIGTRTAGLYSQAVQLLTLPLQLIGGPLQRVFIPTLSRLRRDPQRFRKYIRAILTVMTAVLWPFFAVIAILAPDVIRILFGAEWIDSAPIFSILAISGFSQAVGFVNAWLFISTGQFRRQMWWTIANRIVVLGSLLIGVQWGVLGMAWAYSITTVALTIPGFVIVKRGAQLTFGDLVLPLIWPAVLTIVGVAVSLGLTIFLPTGNSLFATVGNLSIVVIVLGITVLLIKPIREQVAQLAKLVLKR